MKGKWFVLLVLRLVLVLVLVSGMVCGCSGGDNTGKTGEGDQAGQPAGKSGSDSVITSPEQLNDKRFTIGMNQGSMSSIAAEKAFPDANFEYYQDSFIGYTAVAQGKIDAFVYDSRQMRLAIHNGFKGVRVLDEYYGDDTEIAVGISRASRIPDLETKVNQFIRELREDGTLDDMLDRWAVRGVEEMPEIPMPSEPTEHLVIGTVGSVPPYSYYVGTELNGYDIELAHRFAAWLNADLEFRVYSFEGIIPAAVTGEIDCIMSNLNVIAEDQDKIAFSETLFKEKNGIMVRDAGSGAGGKAAGAAEPEYKSFDDLTGKTVSMVTGAPFEELVRSKNPDVGTFTFYNSFPDILLALKSGKTDASLANNAIAELAVNQDPELALFPENLQDGVFGFAFEKGDPALEEWQAAYERIPEETKQALWKKWTGPDASVKTLPDQDWPGENGTVRVAACDTLAPMSYMGEGGTLLGFDEEMLLLVARELDVHVEFTGMEFAAVLSAVQSGKAQIGIGSVIVTPERQEAVDFLEYYPAAFVLVVRAVKVQEEDTSFLAGIRSSFEKTFVREGRYRLFLKGIGTTLLITLLSVLFGTVLGFIVFMLCRGGNRLANTITRFCIWLVQGLPVVVLLMVLYYIAFSDVPISGTAVSVVAFTLVFGAGVYGMLRMGVGAIDLGQTEAAYALGYSDTKAFFRVILPQALPHVMPAYKGEITSLIKATAIVGYIAVQDLTKMGDIVRSRTYEAFFPLFAVALIYLALAAVLTAIVERIEIRIDPRNRKPEEILKGIEERGKRP